MSIEDYIGALLRHSDNIDLSEIRRAQDLARYARRHRAVTEAVLSQMLEHVHICWRAMDGWINTKVEMDQSTWLTQWEYLEVVAKTALDLAEDSGRIYDEEPKIAKLLWDMVICLGDPKWIERIVNEAESQYLSYLTWQLMAVRQASKVALVMIEFRSEFDVPTERF